MRSAIRRQSEKGTDLENDRVASNRPHCLVQAPVVAASPLLNLSERAR